MATTGGTELQRAMALSVATLRTVTDAIKGAPDRHGHLPGARSAAMGDLAAQANGRITKPTAWDTPMGDAQSLGWLDLLAATDAARCYGHLFGGDSTPLFGHLTLARSCLEACVISEWLSDPTISPTECQRRTLAELIYSAKEAKRLGMEEAADADARIALWMSVAAELGWLVSKDTKPVVDGSGRPAMAGAIDRLLNPGVTALGRVQWSYLSGVNHTVWFALRQAFLDEPTPNGLGPTVASVGTASNAVYPQTLCLLRVLRTAAQARMTYMGWVDEAWESAARTSVAHEVELLRRIEAPAGP